MYTPSTKPKKLDKIKCNRCPKMFKPNGKWNRRCPSCEQAVQKLGKQEAGVAANPRWRKKEGKNE